MTKRGEAVIWPCKTRLNRHAKRWELSANGRPDRTASLLGWRGMARAVMCREGTCIIDDGRYWKKPKARCVYESGPGSRHETD